MVRKYQKNCPKDHKGYGSAANILPDVDFFLNSSMIIMAVDIYKSNESVWHLLLQNGDQSPPFNLVYLRFEMR
jgi:hypothetical protein